MAEGPVQGHPRIFVTSSVTKSINKFLNVLSFFGAFSMVSEIVDIHDRAELNFLAFSLLKFEFIETKPASKYNTALFLGGF